MAIETDQIDIQTRLLGAAEFVAAAKAETTALKDLSLQSVVFGKAQESSGRKGFLLMQALFTARRVLYGFSLAVGAAIAGTVALGFQFDSFKQQSTLAFTSLLGNAQLAKNEIQYLFNVAAKTPFTFQNITATARQFLAFGFSLKDTNKYLNVLGDTISAFGLSGDQISHLAVVFGQIHQSGRLLGQDMRQLEQAGVPVFPALRKELGLTQKQITAFMKGQLIIPSQYGIPAIMKYLQTRFGGMAKIQSTTFQGEASTFKDYLSQLMGSLEENLFTKVTKKLGGINNALTILNKTAQTKGFMAVIAQLDSMLGLGGKLYFGIQLLISVFHIWWNIQKMVYQVLRDVTSVMFYLLAPLFLVIKGIEWLTKNAMLPLKIVLYPVVGLLIAFKIAQLYAAITTIFLEGVTVALTIAMWAQQASLVAVFLAQSFLNVAREDGIAYALYTLAVNWGLVGAFEAVTVATSEAAYATLFWTTALLTNPVVLMITAIVAITAAFIYFMIVSKRFRDWMLHYGGFILMMFPITVILGAVLTIIGYWDKIKSAFFGAMHYIEQNWLYLIEFFATGGMIYVFQHLWDPLTSGLQGAISWLENMFSRFFNWILSQAKTALDPRNWLPFGIGSLVGGKGSFNWKKLGMSLIPGAGPFASLFSGFFATGGMTSHPGFAVVGERGPELVWLPGAANVRPLTPMPDVGGFRQLPFTGQASGLRELTLHNVIQLDSGVLANSFAKVMLDQMARA